MRNPVTETDWQADPLWYKDAIIYQVHVKSFFDSDNDGIGDFRGLTEKLDYVQSLGVNAFWLLPFYPSPMRDDGYDISDYRRINAAYGTRRDFRDFVRAAHRRGIKVITELVVNHTSDQHPWFQAARRAPRDSAKRNYYVWSDSDRKFPETRIIFTDTESSNWAWDPVAKQYYWHRFFSHQPDLNLNNPQVVRSVIRLLRFWLDMGVDGLRLDAIPYLCVKEGTSNENLAETHAVIRQIRAAVDSHYDGRMLLAEANQWPEDVSEYFGNGDECHMAYHFPLMPRMYMAIAQEDRHPIVEIMQQTPEIPDNCQWAVFLRNHDELTLEMVTDEERDYMYQIYAADPRMRLNVGIRRRLAPLMNNDGDKIKLMNSMLLSMPGSPIIYYGDELGMGDNVFLGDRNGVRTPMQWSPDRNAGFSRADPQRLYLPPIMDPVYGYEAVNVEAQSRDPSSHLNWMRRILSIRKGRKAFGRGRLEFLRPGNRNVLAYVREYENESLLCVFNLARSAQPVELDLRRYRGRIPVELMGGTPFPPIGDLPYLLTLPAHGFYWFDLATEKDAQAPAWHEQHLPREEAPWLVLFAGLESFDVGAVTESRRSLAARLREQLDTEILPRYLRGQRWFAGKGEVLDYVTLGVSRLWRAAHDNWLLALVEAGLGEDMQRYFVPLATTWEDEKERRAAAAAASLARVRQHARTGLLFDAFADESFWRDVLDGIGRGAVIDVGAGKLHFLRTAAFDELADLRFDGQDIRRPRSEGSNSTFLIGDRLFLKGYRRVREGVNPEWEIGRFLTEVSPYPNVVPAAGALELREPGREPVTLALVQGAVRNQGDGWSYTWDYLTRFVEEAERLEQPPNGQHDAYRVLMRTLGTRTAELHRALAVESGDAAFDPEPIDTAWLTAWVERIVAEAELTLTRLREGAANATPKAKALIAALLESGFSPRADLGAVAPTRVDAVRTRYHGDYHLGQVLLTENDFVITDLEGEPGRGFEERRFKHTPLKDVAGMLRSFAYVRDAVARHVAPRDGTLAETTRARLEDWADQARSAFLDGYGDAIAGCVSYPSDADQAERLLRLARIEKTLYEIRYELDSRPEWLELPLHHLLRIVSEELRNDEAAGL
jgi:maltose alpha-D-glucosyltransferase/alpha-amylase